MAKAIAAQTRQKLDMNQQCLSEGLANFTGSFFQCIPGSGSLTRSAINQQAGASTQWSGVVSALAVALIMLQFAPYARFIPRAALAGILMVSAWKMVDRHALIYHLRATRFDAAIVVVTAVAAIAISVEFCVLIGVFMSFLLAVRRAGRMLLHRVRGVGRRRHSRAPARRRGVRSDPHLRARRGDVLRLRPPPSSGTSPTSRSAWTSETRVVVLRMKRVRNPDAVGLTLLEGFLERMKARNVHVLLCGVRAPLFASMQKTGLAARLDEKEIFLEQPVRQTSTLLAIRYAYELIPDRCPTCPRRNVTVNEKDLYYSI